MKMIKGMIRLEQIFMLSLLLPVTAFLIGRFGGIPELEKFAGYFSCIVVVILGIVAVTGQRSYNKLSNDKERKIARCNQLLDALVSNPDFITEFLNADGAKFEIYFQSGAFYQSDSSLVKTVEREDLLSALTHARDIRTGKKLNRDLGT